MADSCYVCGTEKSLDNCITCEKPVCKSHAGHMKNYYSGDGKKGRACQNCIDEGLANPDYGLSDMHLVVPDAVKRFENKIYPRIHNDLENLTEKVKTESFAEAHILVKELEESIKRTAESVTQHIEQSADKMVAETLVKVQDTLAQLTQELTQAIGHQRVEVSSDAEKIIRELSKAIQISLIYVAVIIVVGLAGIKLILG